jgi:hypothetical protein
MRAGRFRLLWGGLALATVAVSSGVASIACSEPKTGATPSPVLDDDVLDVTPDGLMTPDQVFKAMEDLEAELKKSDAGADADSGARAPSASGTGTGTGTTTADAGDEDLEPVDLAYEPYLVNGAGSDFDLVAEHDAENRATGGDLAIAAFRPAPWTTKLRPRERGEAREADETPERNHVDLRRWDARMLDQGFTPTCSSYATAGALDIALAIRKAPNDDVSAEHLWVAQGKKPGTVAAITAAGATFLVKASDWPNMTDAKPKVDDVKAAGYARLRSTTKLTNRLELYAALAAKKPVLASVTFTTAFRTATSRKGVIRAGEDIVTEMDDAKSAVGHNFVVVGFAKRSDAFGYYIIKNSWGDDWGNKGYGYVNFNYCADVLDRAERAMLKNAQCDFFTIDGVELASDTAENMTTSPAPGMDDSDVPREP